MLVLCARVLPAAQTAPVVLSQSFSNTAAVAVAPLYITRDEVAAKVRDLLAREAELTRIEAEVARDLARIDDLVLEDDRTWGDTVARLLDYYRGVLARTGGPGIPIPDLEDGAHRGALFDLALTLSARIDRLAVERRKLEAAYFEEVGGGPAGGAATPAAAPATAPAEAVSSPHSLDRLDRAKRDRVTEALRQRVTGMKDYRRDAVDGLLLANLLARESGFPGAMLERGVDAATWVLEGSHARKTVLEKWLNEQKARRRGLVHDLEILDALIRHADKRLAELAKPPETPGKTEQRARVAARKKKYEAQQKAKQTELAACKEKAKKLEEQIKDQALGYDALASDRKVAPESGNFAKRNASVSDPRFADLSIRRRLKNRASRETQHLFDISEKFCTIRRTYGEASRRDLRLRPNADTAEWDFFVRAALLDTGLTQLSSRETGIEDSFLGQLDYFNGLAAKFDSFTHGQQGKTPTDSAAMDYGQLALDDLQITIGLFSGMVSFFFDQAKDAVNCVSPIHIPTELDKTWQQIVKKRVVTDRQIDLLFNALDPGLDVAGLRASFGLPDKPALKPYKTYFPSPGFFNLVRDEAHEKGVLEMFLADMEFHRKCDGGLQRIAFSGNRALPERLAAEYVIAYERAGLTLRELEYLLMGRTALDAQSGAPNWKLIMTPVNGVIQLGTAIYTALGGSIEIGEHVARRRRELDQIYELFPKLVKIEFDPLRLAQWNDAAKPEFKDLATHWILLHNNPEYRRFWDTANRLRLDERQEAAAKKEPRHETDLVLLSITASAPGGKWLARASYQEALDYIQLNNYPGAVDALVLASELDPTVVGYTNIVAIEKQLAWITFTRDLQNLAVKVGDDLVMDMLTFKLRQAMAGYLKGKGFKVEMPVEKRGFLEQVSDAFGRQVNPLSAVIPVKEFMDKGAMGGLTVMAQNTATKLVKDKIRDDALIGALQMDAEWADKIADLTVDFVKEFGPPCLDQMVRESRYYRTVELLYESWRLQGLLKEFEGRSTEDILGELMSLRAEWQKYVLDQRVGALLQALALRVRVEDLQDEIAKLVVAEGGITASLAEQINIWSLGVTKQKVLARDFSEDQARLVFAASGFLAGSNMDDAVLRMVKAMERGEGDREQMRELAERARLSLKLLGVGHLRMLKQLAAEEEATKKPGDPEPEDAGKPKDLSLTKVLKVVKKNPQIAASYDAVRAALHLESLNMVLDHTADPERAADFIKEVARLYDRKYLNVKTGEIDLAKKAADKARPDFEKMSAAELVAVMKKTVAIIPTGSGAIRSEYVKGTSDLDFTALLLDGSDALTPAQRAMLQHVFGGAFRMASGGADPDLFDISYMADDVNVPLGRSELLDAPPADLETGVRRMTEADLTKSEQAADRATSDMTSDMKDEQRYQTAGMKKALFYMNRWGSWILVKKNGAWVFARKRNVVPDESMTAEQKAMLQRLAKNEGPEIDESISLDVLLDNRYFQRLNFVKDMLGIMNCGTETAPYAAVMKHLFKYSIREMLGFLALIPEARAELNAMPKKVLEDDRFTADHARVCELMSRALDSPEQVARLGISADDVAVYKQILKFWADVKQHKGGIEDIVAAMSPDGKAPPKGSQEYQDRLKDALRLSMRMSDRLALNIVREGTGPYKPLFAALKSAKARPRAFTEARTLLAKPTRSPQEQETLDGHLKLLDMTAAQVSAASPADMTRRFEAEEKCVRAHVKKHMMPVALQYHYLETSSIDDKTQPTQITDRQSLSPLQREMRKSLEAAGLPWEEFWPMVNEASEHLRVPAQRIRQDITRLRRWLFETPWRGDGQYWDERMAA